VVPLLVMRLPGSGRFLLAVLLLAACAGNAATAGSGTADECAGRADFWIVIQQEYLDRLGDVAVGDLDPPTEQVTAANEWAGTALVEHAREAQTVGCETEVRVGSPEICERLVGLQSRGAAGEHVLAQLLARCNT
jgi:hypothetical protein